MRKLTLPLLVMAALALGALVGPAAAVAKSCSDIQLSGRGYIIGINVKGISCKTGKSIAREHFNKRRAKGGWDGKLNGRVSGYSCRESDRQKSSTSLNARVRCTKGDKRVSFVYQSDR